jgi:hypothetical protein
MRFTAAIVAVATVLGMVIATPVPNPIEAARAYVILPKVYITVW